MAVDPHTWTLPTPIRALVWWPPVALLLGAVAPDAAAWAITLAGVVLAAIGTACSAFERAIARHTARCAAAARSTVVRRDVPTPPADVLPAPGATAEHRAA